MHTICQGHESSIIKVSIDHQQHPMNFWPNVFKNDALFYFLCFVSFVIVTLWFVLMLKSILNCRSCATLDSELIAFSSPSITMFQVYFHWHLHFRVGDKDISERILHNAVHLSERSMELVGLQRHCHGVSSCTIHV